MITFFSVFPPFRGGIAKFSDYVYRSLNDRTSVEAINFRRLYPSLLFPGESQRLEYVVDEYAEPVYHSYNPLNWPSTARRLVNYQPQWLIYSYWHPFFAPGYIQVFKRARKLFPKLRIAAIAHNILPHERFPGGKQLTRSLMDHTDQVILLSKQTEIEYRAMHLAASYHRLFHPVYREPRPQESLETLRERYGIAPDETVLLFFGLIRKYKGLDIFIDALNEMDLAGLKIRPLIVGEFYTEKMPILKRIADHHLERYKIIDRFVSDAEAAELMTLSDAMVLPYRTASQSGVLSNAVNFHLPVIVSNLPGLREHIDDGDNGFVFKNEDPDALRKAIMRFMEKGNKAELAEAMSQLKEQLSWARFADELLQTLDITASSAKKPSTN